MNMKPFELFHHAQTIEQMRELQQLVQNGGYSFFRRILEGLQQQIKTFTDEESEQILQLLAKAKQYFPHPGKISPSWQTIWEELEEVIIYKINMLQRVPSSEREGDWQIVMDNPYTNQEIVCYPNLSFLEAAYLYGYFRPKLDNNEYIQIQKVHKQFTEYGHETDGAS